MLDRFVGIGFVEAAYMLRRVFEQMMDHVGTCVRNSKVLFSFKASHLEVPTSIASIEIYNIHFI
jgi:hypothetical protein